MCQKQIDNQLDSSVYDSMYELFVQICKFWRILDSPEQYKYRLFVFMNNKMRNKPIYRRYYLLAKYDIEYLTKIMGKSQAYEFLFTNHDINKQCLNHPLAVTRQKVSNEFITFQANTVNTEY